MRTALLSLLTVALAAAHSPPGTACAGPNDSLPDLHQCDLYYKCVGGTPVRTLCPDGLVYNLAKANSNNPCDYPNKVDCTGRENLQPAKPSPFCPRSWGYFGTGIRGDCGRYYNCVDGQEFPKECPKGLAFSSVTLECQWPDEVPECDHEAYLGFSCPRTGRNFGYPRYANAKDCREYFVCVKNIPRLHTCERGLVFSPVKKDCAEPETVQGCENYYPADVLEAIRLLKNP